MAPGRDRDPLELYRNGYLRFKSVLEDRVTGLPSYPLLFDRLRAMLDQRRHIGVVHLAVEDLGLVESLYGWQVFDRLVARAASGLREAAAELAPPGTELAVNAVPGERFVLFVPEALGGHEVTGDFLRDLAERLRVRVAEMLRDEDCGAPGRPLSVRTGYALLSENPFFRFERRVHAAVEQARTRSDRRARRREQSWAEELRRIIREAEVSTLFQPVVDLDSGDVLGYEALARGPRGSALEQPRAMFSLSDRLGIEVELDRLCRATALRALRRPGGRGKVFLNLLAHSLEDPEIRDGRLRARLEEFAVEPSDVVMEVSERGADEDLDRFSDGCGFLREQGFGLALDDVGTGYASLATLERVRPDYLKLHPTLVRGADRNLIQQDLLSSLAGIAGRIGAEAVAVGIETEEEASAVRTAGARYGQGYLFAVPSPMDAGIPGTGHRRPVRSQREKR